MTISPTSFLFTSHALDRLQERFPMLGKELAPLKPAIRLKRAYELLAGSIERPDIEAEYARLQVVRGDSLKDGKRYFFKNANILFVGVDRDAGYRIVTVLEWNRVSGVIERAHQGEQHASC